MMKLRSHALLITGLGLLLVAGIVAISGMASGLGRSGSAEGPSISLDRAQQSVQSFVDRSGRRGLVVDELMEFDQNFYALVKEKDSGIGAFELLVNKSTGAVRYEPGPDMMWNDKYGSMGGAGHMGFAVGSGAMSVSRGRATAIAQRWLDQARPGSSAGTPDAFYGYYTFHFMKDGRINGMLSVNGATGRVWFHTWHGNFIRTRDLGA